MKPLAVAAVLAVLLWGGLHEVISRSPEIAAIEPDYAATTGYDRMLAAIRYSLYGALAAGLLGWLFAGAGKRKRTGVLACSAVLAGVPLAMGGAVYFSRDYDPWSAFPGGPSPRLKSFIPRHPDLTVTDLGQAGVRVSWPNFDLVFAETDLVGADLRWEPCPAAPPAHIPAAYPGSECLGKVRLDYRDGRRLEPGDEASLERWVYRLKATSTQPFYDYYEQWAKDSGAQLESSAMSSGGKSGRMYYGARYEWNGKPMRVSAEGQTDKWIYLQVWVPKTLGKVEE